jgi:hypothetical protein
MSRIRLGRKTYPLPGSKPVRITMGVFLVLGGMLGFLPVLGFWMIPLGLLILSVDSWRIRRMRRRFEVWMGNRRRQKAARRAQERGDSMPADKPTPTR